MAPSAQRLQVGAVEGKLGMRDDRRDVVNLLGRDRLAPCNAGTAQRFLTQHLGAHITPASGGAQPIG
jgi:hypothetical protein